MSSGVAVEDSAISAFQELKNKRTFNTLFYRLSDDLSTIVPDFKGTLTHDELLGRLPQDEPRFVVYDFTFSKGDGEGQRTKIILISWCPDGTAMKQKMVYSSSFNTLKNMLAGASVYAQATDVSDLGYDELVSRAS
ncbi:actin depolymerization factor/cofilin-like domain-containing protein [Streptomyces sp. NPDC091371]|uniref:actin-binding ADF family protein n=1 Tax=Streptomyces sp. NPDC091371 TaxID=3155303 RepID=UPI00343CDBC0